MAPGLKICPSCTKGEGTLMENSDSHLGGLKLYVGEQSSLEVMNHGGCRQPCRPVTCNLLISAMRFAFSSKERKA